MTVVLTCLFLCYRQIDERYKSLKEVASTRAILSMGLACFKVSSDEGFFKKKTFKSSQQKAAYEQIRDCIDTSVDEIEEQGDQPADDENFHITATVFDFLCLCNEYIIETKSMTFLVQQGFDFNELAKKGIPFISGNDSVSITF